MPQYSLSNKLYVRKLPDDLKVLTIVEEACFASARILMNLIKLDCKWTKRKCQNFSAKSRKNFTNITSITFLK